MAKNKTTRNTKFNGYEFEKDGSLFYASIASTSVEKIIKITNNYYSDIKLLNFDEYIKVKGTDIVAYTEKYEHSYLDESLSNYQNIIQNANLNTQNKYFYIFGAPYKMVLDNEQAYNNCAVESVLNNLVNAGIMTIEDQTTTEKNILKKLWKLGIAADNGKIGTLDKKDGGMSASDIKEAFDLYGIKTTVYGSYSNIEGLGHLVKNGFGVVLNVNSDYLWLGRRITEELDHSVSIIGVLYENENPNYDEMPVAFIIHDTGSNQMTRFITPDDLKNAGLYDENGGLTVTITQEPIKKMANNINVTGDEHANVIYGNSGNNTIKGLGGNDTLYGENGDDKIYGGSGKDTIYGGLGNDTIYGGNGNDILYGEEGNDIIHGGAGNDTIYGGNGRNVLYGEDGDDIIYGGDYQNRILGGKGNDTIYGGNGNDTINAGDGNDIIYASYGEDNIETGAGKDTIIFDNPDFDIVTAYNSKGSVTFKFEYDINEFEMVPYIDKKIDSNCYDLYLTDSDKERGFILKNFFNYKKNTSKTAYLETDTNKKYRFTATKSAKATVADTRTDGKHKDINNILFTTNTKGTTITTSKKNDVVFMYDSPNMYYNEAEYKRKDKITYTGGKDTYYSLVGDTTYIVKFNEKTNLVIADGIFNVKKIKLDEYDTPYIGTVEASNNDTIKFSCEKDDLIFLFDMDKNGKITKNTNFYALYNTSNPDSIKNNIANILSDNRDSSGFVVMAGFFNKNKTSGDSDFWGKGLIENFYTKENDKYVLYDGLEAKINSIKTSVINWFENNSDYDSVFEVLSSNTAPENINELINCYTQNA